MKILIISPTQSGIGGVAQYVYNLSKYLKKNGHQVDIISSENTFTIPIRRLKNPSFMVSSFIKTIFRKKYDIVHAQNVISAPAMKNVSGKKILSLWGVFGDQITLLHGKTIGNFSKKFEKMSLDWADLITIPSKDLYEKYKNSKRQIEFLPNAIDINSLSKDVNRLYDKQIIFAGRLSKEKGILTVIEAANFFPPDINLLILGIGPEEIKVKELANIKSNIHYLGYQTKEKTISLIRGSDILIQPSLMEGSISSTLLESMACKIPVITTTAGANKEILEHMRTAFLVMPNSPNELMDAINLLLANQNLRHTLSENAFLLAKNFDWESIGKYHLELYEKTLKR